MRTHGKLYKTFLEQLAEDIDGQAENRQTLMDDKESFKEKVMACRVRLTRQGKKVITKITRKTYHYRVVFNL